MRPSPPVLSVSRERRAVLCLVRRKVEVEVMIFRDDRTPEQKRTHSVIVLMTDRCLSGWGGAGRGPSYAGWACKPELANTIEQRIRGRSDARRVRIVGGNYRPPSIEGHCHIYVADA